MEELSYSEEEEEKTRLDNGILFYPPYPEELYRDDSGRLWSKKYPCYISYPYFVRNLYIADCYISRIKNLIRQLIDNKESKQIIDSAFVILEKNLKARDRIKNEIQKFEIR